MNEFHALIDRLYQAMSEEYAAVCAQKNPVIRILDAADTVQMTVILQQYSFLPGAFVVFLESVRNQAANAGWAAIAEELDNNLAEELGSKTQGVSHADILAEGLEMCLAAPVKTAVPSTATIALLEKLEAIAQKSAAYLSGAAYAIEATAVPELQIILKILDLLLEGAIPESLQYFFDMHLNEWEPEHEATLQKAIAHHLTPDQFDAFELGFRAMLTSIDSWWLGLAAEALTWKL